MLSIEEHAKQMWENSHSAHLSPAILDENDKAIVDVGNRSQGVLEELEIAHIYIEQLNSSIRQLHNKINALEEVVAELKSEK